MPLVILNGIRGGVGATSTTITLARQLTLQKKKVIIIDNCIDNILYWYLSGEKKQTTLSQALLKETPIQEAIFDYQSHLQILPFGVVDQKDSLLLQSSLSAKQNVDNFLSHFIQHNPDTIILMDLQYSQYQDTIFSSWLEKADILLTITMAESNCHIRLNQHKFSANEYVLINQFRATSQVQQDFRQYWQTTSLPLCPIVLHQDEASLEACASQLPLYDYRSNCMLVEEINQLTQWCLALLIRKEG